MAKKVTMTDIAKAAGVSQTLVSFVLSGKNDMGIGENTRKKVLDTARKMGYCSSAASSMLKLGRSGFVLLTFANDAGKDLGAVIHSVDKVCVKSGYKAILSSPLEKADAVECVNLFREGRIDGVILFGASDSVSDALSNANIPFVCIDGTSEKQSAEGTEKLLAAVLSGGEQKSTRTKKAAVRRKKSDARSVKAEESKPQQPAKQESIWLL